MAQALYAQSTLNGCSGARTEWFSAFLVVSVHKMAQDQQTTPPNIDLSPNHVAPPLKAAPPPLKAAPPPLKAAPPPLLKAAPPLLIAAPPLKAAKYPLLKAIPLKAPPPRPKNYVPLTAPRGPPQFKVPPAAPPPPPWSSLATLVTYRAMFTPIVFLQNRNLGTHVFFRTLSEGGGCPSWRTRAQKELWSSTQPNRHRSAPAYLRIDRKGIDRPEFSEPCPRAQRRNAIEELVQNARICAEGCRIQADCLRRFPIPTVDYPPYGPPVRPYTNAEYWV